ncbi:MAG TPA: hypothetical protein VFZ57_00980, partial [Thermoanaerobaculia bacterium]|nr:hypothetical protein [Thermoanaerobaculia bacterium]
MPVHGIHALPGILAEKSLSCVLMYEHAAPIERSELRDGIPQHVNARDLLVFGSSVRRSLGDKPDVMPRRHEPLR